MNKLFFLIAIMALVVGSIFVACGDDDDDNDDNDTATTDDDVDDDADDTSASDCELAMAALYEDCGLTLTDTDGVAISEADAVSYCESGDTTATCAASCALSSSTCDDITTCFNDSCAG
jgi:hypothetical protein